MARQLKTFTTSAGFFDLAIAAPSMKAALEAWGARSNLFQHGFARVSDDPAIVKATMARPGVVLRRAVGSSDPFSEHAALPRTLPAGKRQARPPASRATRSAAPAPKAPRSPPPRAPADAKAERASARRAALAFEKEQKRRDAEQKKEEAAAARERRKRDRTIARVQAALDKATREHAATIADIDRERAALDRRAEAEGVRWQKKKEELEAALRKARSVSYLRSI